MRSLKPDCFSRPAAASADEPGGSIVIPVQAFPRHLGSAQLPARAPPAR
jgi:hypothetical protein